MQFVETETWLSTFNYIISFKTYRKGPLVMFLSCLRYPIWIAQYIQHKSDREPIQKPKEIYRLAPSCIISYYTLSFITTNIYIYIRNIYIYICICMTLIMYLMSSRQNPLHLSNYYVRLSFFLAVHIAFQGFVPLSLLKGALSLYRVSCTSLTKVLLPYYSGLQPFWP